MPRCFIQADVPRPALLSSSPCFSTKTRMLPLSRSCCNIFTSSLCSLIWISQLTDVIDVICSAVGVLPLLPTCRKRHRRSTCCLKDQKLVDKIFKAHATSLATSASAPAAAPPTAPPLELAASSPPTCASRLPTDLTNIAVSLNMIKIEVQRRCVTDRPLPALQHLPTWLGLLWRRLETKKLTLIPILFFKSVTLTSSGAESLGGCDSCM